MTNLQWEMDSSGRLFIYEYSNKVKEEINELIEYFRIGGCDEKNK